MFLKNEAVRIFRENVVGPEKNKTSVFLSKFKIRQSYFLIEVRDPQSSVYFCRSSQAFQNRFCLKKLALI